jgi:hypothetical protein
MITNLATSKNWKKKPKKKGTLGFYGEGDDRLFDTLEEWIFQLAQSNRLQDIKKNCQWIKCLLWVHKGRLNHPLWDWIIHNLQVDTIINPLLYHFGDETCSVVVNSSECFGGPSVQKTKLMWNLVIAQH